MGLRHQVDPDSFLLIDEADHVLIDGLQKVTNQNVLGLTATAFNEDFELERLHLERQGFKIYNSGISGFIDPATATSKATVQQFFKQSEGYAKLIFAQGSAIETFLE